MFKRLFNFGKGKKSFWLERGLDGKIHPAEGTDPGDRKPCPPELIKKWKDDPTLRIAMEEVLTLYFSSRRELLDFKKLVERRVMGPPMVGKKHTNSEPDPKVTVSVQEAPSLIETGKPSQKDVKASLTLPLGNAGQGDDDITINESSEFMIVQGVVTQVQLSESQKSRFRRYKEGDLQRILARNIRSHKLLLTMFPSKKIAEECLTAYHSAVAAEKDAKKKRIDPPKN